MQKKDRSWKMSVEARPDKPWKRMWQYAIRNHQGNGRAKLEIWMVESMDDKAEAVEMLKNIAKAVEAYAEELGSEAE